MRRQVFPILRGAGVASNRGDRVSERNTFRVMSFYTSSHHCPFKICFGHTRWLLIKCFVLWLQDTYTRYSNFDSQACDRHDQ